MSQCEIESCTNRADVFDPIDNKICFEHMRQMIEEDPDITAEDFDSIDYDSHMWDDDSWFKGADCAW